MISAQALGYLQCLHRTPRLLDPSGSLDITPRHSISAEFKQRPWKTCQKHHIIHTLCLFLKKKWNQGFTVNETMICRVWPKFYIAVCCFNKCCSGWFNKAKTYWMGLLVSKKKQIHHRSSSPPRFLQKIPGLASFDRDTDLTTQREDSCAGCCINWCSRQIPPVVLRASNTNQPAHKNLDQISLCCGRGP